MPSVKPESWLPESWLKVTPRGLYCEPGDFTIDPHRPVGRAVVTHGHGDHARPGNRAVLATPETLAIMRKRYGADAGGNTLGLPLAPINADGTHRNILWISYDFMDEGLIRLLKAKVSRHLPV